MHKQTLPYGCGVYAVANALDLGESFISEERLEASKDGNNNGQLSKWMQDFGLDIFIEPMYYDHFGRKLPDSALYYRPQGDKCYLPVLLTVAQSEDGKRHKIAGRIDNDGHMILFDSLKNNNVLTDLKKVNEMYPVVLGISLFRRLGSGDWVFYYDEGIEKKFPEGIDLIGNSDRKTVKLASRQTGNYWVRSKAGVGRNPNWRIAFYDSETNEWLLKGENFTGYQMMRSFIIDDNIIPEPNLENELEDL